MYSLYLYFLPIVLSCGATNVVDKSDLVLWGFAVDRTEQREYVYDRGAGFRVQRR